MKNDDNSAIILLSCPDQPGILSAVTEFINKNRGNILYLDQYVNREDEVFFMRIKWDLTNFSIAKKDLEASFKEGLGTKYSMNYKLYFSDIKPRMAIFVSKMSHCLYDLLSRFSSGDWHVEIPLVISNHPDLESVANQFNIPFYCFPINKDNKLILESSILKLLKQNNITFCVLARYMQILSDDFISIYPNKIINIHHSFLPAFKGARPYHAAHERGVKIIGATSHYVTSDLDEGPIIEQDVTRISHLNTVDELIRKGRDLEKIVLSRAVEKHIERKTLTYGNRTIVFQ